MITQTILVPLSVATLEALLARRSSPDEPVDQTVRRLCLTEPTKAAKSRGLPPAPNRKRRRERQNYVLTVCGQTAYLSNIPEALGTAYRWLDELEPGFLERFSAVHGQRRQYVGRSIAALHPDPAFAREHAFRIKDGWWGIGNCALERARNTVLRRACEMVGLRLGRDVDLIKLGEKRAQPMSLDEFEALAAALASPNKSGQLAH